MRRWNLCGCRAVRPRDEFIEFDKDAYSSDAGVTNPMRWRRRTSSETRCGALLVYETRAAFLEPQWNGSWPNVLQSPNASISKKEVMTARITTRAKRPLFLVITGAMYHSGNGLTVFAR